MDLPLEVYGGSRLLQPIADKVSLPIDQLNFVTCQLLALTLGYPYRTVFSARHCSTTFRHLLQIIIGLPMCYFCFGRQTIHILLQSTITLALIKYLRIGLMEKAVFVFTMGYLCLTHIYRVIYDYGGYTLDITGPIMITTQQLSCLAFAIADGNIKDSRKLSPVLKEQAIRRIPSCLEYFSFVLCFHKLMVGPFCFYKDYKIFIEGSSSRAEKISGGSDAENHNISQDIKLEKTEDIPSPFVTVVRKLTVSAGCAAVFMIILPRFERLHMTETDFFQKSFLQKTLYTMLCTTLTRFRYYFAWKLATAVNANAGLGFRGYNKETGSPDWELLDNADIIKVEFATSLKVLLDHWNKTTSYWLRYIVYERTRSTLGVFFLSALWHGFYMGYYVTFMGGALFISASRQVRRFIRPLFQGSKTQAFVYDVLTFLTTQIGLAYLTFPFVMLEFWTSFAVYRSLYFWLHATSIIILLASKFLAPKSSSKGDQKPSAIHRSVGATDSIGPAGDTKKSS